MSTIKLHWLRFFGSPLGMMLGVSLLSGLAYAQTVTGTISGVVIDVSHNAIVGATVIVINTKTGDRRVVTTNESGGFSVPALQPDVYTVRVEQKGFRTLERQNNVLSANENLGLERLVLEVGQVSETVTTVAEGATVETASSDLTGRLTSDQIELISTKGRDITSLLRLLPGVSYIDDVESVGDGFGTDLPNVSGQRGRSSIATVNGLNASEPSGSNKVSMTTNQDAIAEVKVLRNNYSPEFNNGGAQINIVTKSGKKNYFGSAYYFLRNEALNANSFFNNRQGLEKARYRHNIWGFNFGGPVQVPWLYPNKSKQKLFFFYSLEKPHTITPSGAKFVTVPTALERDGDFSQSFTGLSGGNPVKAYIRDPLITTGNCNATDQSACFRDPSRATTGNPQGLNIIPRNRFNPSGVAILNYFPAPNAIGGRNLAGNAFNYVIQKSVDVPKQSQVIRVDFKPTEKDTFFVNAQWWTADNEGFDTSGWPSGDNNRWGISSHYLYRDNGMSINWVRLISPTMVNEASIGIRHDSEGFVPSDGEIDRLTRTSLKYTAPQLFPANNTLGTIPRATSWGGLSQQASVANINWLDRWGEVGDDYILPSITDNFTLNRENHTYKAGIYIERIRNGEAPGGNWTGTFNFSSNVTDFTPGLGNTGHPYANALTGSFRQYSESSARPHTDLERVLVQWYVQDQWKVNRRLTLNYGARMGWYSQWTQRNLDASSFDATRFDPGKAPVLYRPFCVGGTPATAACANPNRRAQNPVTGALSTNVNLVGTFVPGVGDKLNGLAVGTEPGVPHGFKKPAPIQFQPRFGFAWDVFGTSKTVLRAHGGVYHSTRTGGGTTGGNLVSNPPFQRNVTIDYGTIDNLVNLVSTALERPAGLNAVEVNTKTPTIYNFSVGIQQEIGFKTLLEVSYVGSLARHLGELRNINSVPDGARFVDLNPQNRNPFSTGALADDFLRPYAGYGDINVVMGSGGSSYNGLQVQVSRRYAQQFQFGIAYTWHKTLDYANDDSSNVSFPRPYKAFNYGPADHDQSHIFTSNYIWDIPGLGRRFDNRVVKAVFDGWQLSGTTSLVTGRPKSVGVSYSGGTTDITGGEINARPFVLCNPNRQVANAADGTPVFVDASCFARPLTRGEIGNAQRNLIRRPGVVNSDLAFFKNIRLREKLRLQFRWETYNIFNHTNFNDINTDLTLTLNTTTNQVTQTNPLFGQPITARSSRVMQGSLRINF